MRGTDGGSRVEFLFSLEGHLWDTAWANMAIGMMTEAMVRQVVWNGSRHICRYARIDKHSMNRNTIRQRHRKQTHRHKKISVSWSAVHRCARTHIAHMLVYAHSM